MQAIQNFLDIIISLGGALFMASIIRPAVRDKWTPAVFAFVLFWVGAGMIFIPFFNIWLYRLLGIAYMFALAFLLSGFKNKYFRKNGAWIGFVVFISWFCLIGYKSEGSIGESSEVAFKLIRMVLIGFLVCRWAMSTPDGFHRLIKAATVGAFCAALLYMAKGSWSVSALEDMGGRMVVDTSGMVGESENIRGAFNVNRFALLTSMLLPYPFLMFMCDWHDRRDKWYRILAIASCLVLTLVLIRTGSRNGGVALLALGWFFLTARTGLKIGKKIVIGVMLFLAASFAVAHFVGTKELRVFQFLQEEEKGGFEHIGTGRGEIFMNIYDSMTPAERIFGQGIPWQMLMNDSLGTQVHRSVGNCHSMYMQIFKQSGCVGVALFFVFCVVFFVSANKAKRTRQIAMLFFFIFILTGIGEAANMTESAGYAKYGLGIALALCYKGKDQYDLLNGGDYTKIQLHRGL